MESLEAMQARHRKEQRDLQGRITNKKKNATKKSRKGVNDECAELERQLKERQEQEIATLNAGGDNTENAPDEAEERDDNSPDQQANGTAADDITQQLEQTSLSSSATPSHPEPESSTSQPQQSNNNKKRNRQKERMARRAAEQEAAAVAAEAEASSMTDHRKIEKTYLLKEFRTHNLVEKEIQPDGHCLFSAVADQLQTRGIPLSLAWPEPSSSSSSSSSSDDTTKGGGGKPPPPPPYRVVRRAATDYMQAHADDFAPFLEEPLEGYAAKIRDTAEWGGQLELAALASAYGVAIRVLQDGRTETIEPGADSKKGVEERQTIWLAYYRHGYGLGEHYNSLRKAE
ncbi:hypothetical protein Hte_009810 [Hypoxylon texense]